jgi:hypothetical protein
MAKRHHDRTYWTPKAFPEPQPILVHVDSTTTIMCDYFDDILDTGAAACLDVFRQRSADGTHRLLAVMTITLPTNLSALMIDISRSTAKLIELDLVRDDVGQATLPAETKSPEL